MYRVFLLYALSGLVSLGYQVAWFRIYVDRFGSTNLTFALVVCCFIGGLGVGSLVSERLCRLLSVTLRIKDPLRLYGLVELLVSLTVTFTLLTDYLPADTWGSFPYHLSEGMYRPNAGYQFTQLVLAILCVFIPCVFMGATFPLLCDAYRGRVGTQRFPSALYAFNTLGACCGVLACLFFLLPTLGHERMFWLLIGLNVTLGIYFLIRGGAAEVGARTIEGVDQPRDGPDGRDPQSPMLLTLAVLSGLLAGALEGDMFKRVDFVSCGNSGVMALISFWAILGILLASWTVRIVPGVRLAWIKAAWVIGFLVYAGTWQARNLVGKSIRLFGEVEREAQVVQVAYLGGFLDNFGNTLLFVGAWVFPAFFCVSLLLPFVCNQIHAERRRLGLAYGLNTLAFCVGMIGFTQVAPRVSVFYSMKLVMALYAISVILLLAISDNRPQPVWKPIVAVLFFGAACLVTPRGFDPSYMIPGGFAATSAVRALKSNGAHTTYVVAAPDGDFIYFDRHPMSSTRMPQTGYMRLMAHFPLLAQPDPKRALLICYGVGNTASAIATHDTIEAIDVVELNERIIETAAEFSSATNAVHDDPRIRFIIDDGRSYLSHSDESYDLITSEPPPPLQAGTYRLYTRDYYEQALAHLSPRGMMTQWIPTYQMPADAVRLSIRTFIKVFPHALIFTGGDREFILVGSPSPIDLENIARRFYEQPNVVADLRRSETPKPLTLLARIVQGERALHANFGEGRVLRDVHNDLEFVFHDPRELEVIKYAPFEIAEDETSLTGAVELRDVLTHLGRLRYHVPRYPLPTLLTAQDIEQPRPRLSDVDWVLVMQLLQRASQLQAQGQFDAAYRAAEKALELAPEEPRGLLLMASLQVKLGLTSAALETREHFHRIEPEEAIGFGLLGAALLQDDRPAEAMVALARAVELDPRSPEARTAFGTTLLRNGNFDEGIRQLREVLILQPGHLGATRMLESALEERASQPPDRARRLRSPAAKSR